MIEDIVPPKQAGRQPGPSGPDTHSDQGQISSQDNNTVQPVAQKGVLPLEPTLNNQQNSTLPQSSEISSSKPTLPSKKPFWKKRKFIIAVLVVLVLAGAVTALMLKKDPPVTQKTAVQQKTAPAPQPTVITSPLSGVPVSAGLEKRPVTAIMLENSLDARPQSGLRDAGVVFEAIAEGGITRFLALYQEGQPTYIGPVRSLRPYYLDWAAPFDAPIAHVGGSLDSLNQIRNPGEGLKDLDQFTNPGTFRRIPQRVAPHNVYTGFDHLNVLLHAKGFNSSSFKPFDRKKEQPSPAAPFKKINFTLSGFYYNVHYDYDPAANTYLRSEGGKPHVDTTSAADPSPYQLRPKVVMALVMPYSYGAANDGFRSTYNTYGSGKLFLFQDGTSTEGTWTKPNRKTQFSFTDATGKPLTLNPGQTWITIVSAPTGVTAGP